jgi:ASC-1-like (ASCH) protein
MHHIAIMKKQWKLIDKILAGSKTLESRWYVNKRDPWNKVKVGDTIFFKNTGEPVTAKATVSKVLQFENITPQQKDEIYSTNQVFRVRKLVGYTGVHIYYT